VPDRARVKDLRRADGNMAPRAGPARRYRQSTLR